MIRLTLLNGKHWYVNPDHIVGIKSGHKYGAEIESDRQTGIEHTIDVTQVQESPQEVARKVLEWRLAMWRYNAIAKALASASENLNAYNNELDEEEKTLMVLSGLEEPDHDWQCIKP